MPPPPAPLIESIRNEAASFPGRFAFYGKRLDTGEELGLDADAVMPPASTIKLAILAEFYRQAEAGAIDLDRRVELRDNDRSPGSGVLRYLQPGLNPTVRDLARLMVILSDNVATTRVLRLIGVESMHRTLDAWGLPNTRLFIPPDPARGPRGYGASTPRELAWLLQGIAEGTLVSPRASAEMKEHLSFQQYGDQVPRWLPFNLYAADRGEPSPVQVYNKTGFSVGVRTDAAIVECPTLTYVIVTMNEDSPDHGFHPDHEGNLLNATISRLIFNAWSP